MKSKKPRRKTKPSPYELTRRAVPREVRRVVLFKEISGQCVPWMRVDKSHTNDDALTMEQAVKRFGLAQGALRAMWLSAFQPFTDFADYEDLLRQYPGAAYDPNKRPADNIEDISFHPELMDWLEPGFGEPPPGTPNGIAIYDADPKTNFMPREWLFTIIVNPAFTPAMVKKIAMLISRAPDLWRELRECAGIELNDINNWKTTSSAIESLMYAAGHWPFEYLCPDKDEENLIVSSMEKRQALRLERKGATDAKK